MTDDDLEGGLSETPEPEHPDTDELPSPLGSSAPPVVLDIPGAPRLPTEMPTLTPSELPPHPTPAQEFVALLGNLLKPITRKLESVHTKLDTMAEHQEKQDKLRGSDWRMLAAEVKGARQDIMSMSDRMDEIVTRIDDLETRVSALEGGRE